MKSRLEVISGVWHAQRTSGVQEMAHGFHARATKYLSVEVPKQLIVNVFRATLQMVYIVKHA
jgi:hypothetical protein